MLKASSLVEVVIALLIMMVVFTSSAMLYEKIINNNPIKKYRLQKELQSIATDIKEHNYFANTQYEENGIVIFQYCESYQASSLLLYLRLEAVVSNKIIAVHEEIFLKDSAPLY